MNYKSILSQKSISSHQLNRYCNFISSCQEKNKNNKINKFHKHHICPKANDMFPEFKSFKDHPWNCVKLSYRQHFIAHLILNKVFKEKSQWYALNQMINVGGFRNSKKYNSFIIKFSEKLRQDIVGRTGMVNSGWKYIYNTITKKYTRLKKDELLPENCIFKNPEGKKQPDYIKTYHDIENNEYRLDTRYEIQDIYFPGRSPKSKEKSKQKAMGNKSATGLKWFYDPKTNESYRLEPNSAIISELNLVAGASDVAKKKLSEKCILDKRGVGSKNPAFGTTTYYDPTSLREFKIKPENEIYSINQGLIKGRSPLTKEKQSKSTRGKKKTRPRDTSYMNFKTKIIFADNTELEFVSIDEFVKWSKLNNFSVNRKLFNIGKITMASIKQKTKLYLLGVEVIVEKS